MHDFSTKIITLAASITGGIYTSLGKINLSILQIRVQQHITPEQAVLVAEHAAIGAIVGGIIGYFLKKGLDKIFKSKSS